MIILCSTPMGFEELRRLVLISVVVKCTISTVRRKSEERGGGQT